MPRDGDESSKEARQCSIIKVRFKVHMEQIIIPSALYGKQRGFKAAHIFAFDLHLHRQCEQNGKKNLDFFGQCITR